MTLQKYNSSRVERDDLEEVLSLLLACRKNVSSQRFYFTADSDVCYSEITIPIFNQSLSASLSPRNDSIPSNSKGNLFYPDIIKDFDPFSALGSQDTGEAQAL